MCVCSFQMMFPEFSAINHCLTNIIRLYNQLLDSSCGAIPPHALLRLSVPGGPGLCISPPSLYHSFLFIPPAASCCSCCCVESQSICAASHGVNISALLSYLPERWKSQKVSCGPGCRARLRRHSGESRTHLVLVVVVMMTCRLLSFLWHVAPEICCPESPTATRTRPAWLRRSSRVLV